MLLFVRRLLAITSVNLIFSIAIISGLATLWIILLCCYVFTQWGGMDHLESE